MYSPKKADNGEKQNNLIKFKQSERQQLFNSLSHGKIFNKLSTPNSSDRKILYSGFNPIRLGFFSPVLGVALYFYMRYIFISDFSLHFHICIR